MKQTLMFLLLTLLSTVQTAHADSDALYHLPNLPAGSTITLLQDVTLNANGWAQVSGDSLINLHSFSDKIRILPAGTVLTTTGLGQISGSNPDVWDSTRLLDFLCKTSAGTSLEFEFQDQHYSNDNSIYFNESLTNEFIRIQVAPSVIIH